MIKVVTLIKRQEGLSRGEFVEYWRGPHIAKTLQISEIRRYVTNAILSDLSSNSESDPPYDGISELWFDSIEAMTRGFESAAGQRNFADNANYQKLAARRSYVVDERIERP